MAGVSNDKHKYSVLPLCDISIKLLNGNLDYFFFDAKKNFIEERIKRKQHQKQPGTDPKDKHLQSKGGQIQN